MHRKEVLADLSGILHRSQTGTETRSRLSRRRRCGAHQHVVIAARLAWSDIQLHQNEFIRMMLDTGQAMFPHVFRRRFTLMHFPEPGLVLCDRPLALYVGPERRRSDRGVGIANAEELWLPLDRTRVLVLHDYPELDEGEMELPTPFRDSFNQGIIANAVGEIYCHPVDREIVQHAELPDPNQPLLGFDGGSWFDLEADGVRAPPRRRWPHRYHRPTDWPQGG